MKKIVRLFITATFFLVFTENVIALTYKEIDYNAKQMTEAQFDIYSETLKGTIIKWSSKVTDVDSNWFSSNYGVKMDMNDTDIVKTDMNDTDIVKTDMDDTVSITIKNVPKLIDYTLGDMGNMGTCSKRIYWANNTKIKNIDNNNIASNNVNFYSRVRYEQWACGIKEYLFFGSKKDIKIFQKTKTVDITIFAEFDSEESQTLDITAQVINIRDFPDFVEKIFKLRTKHTLKSIDIPHKNVSVEKITLSSTNNGSVTIEIKMKEII